MDDFVKRIQDKKIGGKYSLVRRLGEGGFGAVYLGRDFDAGEDVALKLEHHSLQPSVLEIEADTYANFKSLPGFPQMYWYGDHDDYKIMAFELLGPSLEDLLAYCDGTFSLKTVLMIMDQLLGRFQALHAKGLLHRDVKPQNCLLGTGENGNLVYITDFGLAKEYDRTSKNVGEEDRVVRSCLVGTARFASIQAHQGYAQSPKDDLEALGYMMIYFLKGHLPWQGLRAQDDEEKYRCIMEKKMALSLEDLCSELPVEFLQYMQDVKSLPPGKKPAYRKMQAQFRHLAEKEGIVYDNVYDWTIRWYLEHDTRKCKASRN